MFEDVNDDGPAFVSPPFFVIFLTTAKVIISAVAILAVIGVIALFAFVLGAGVWINLR